MLFNFCILFQWVLKGLWLISRLRGSWYLLGWKMELSAICRNLIGWYRHITGLWLADQHCPLMVRWRVSWYLPCPGCYNTLLQYLCDCFIMNSTVQLQVWHLHCETVIYYRIIEGREDLTLIARICIKYLLLSAIWRFRQLIL